jgi:tRNA(Ile)-lysidine synthase
MDNLLSRFETYIATEQLFRHGQRLLVTVSGGVDSVVLARLCRSAGYHIEIAHCNFQLRGEESFRDEEYTAQFAEMINAPFHVRRFDTILFAENHTLSIQEAARELRYTWFSELAEQFGLDRILTAHHADDNVETMMMNLFKGTGIAGMRGILPLSGSIARPLLFASRKDIERYAQDHGIGYVEDSSNLTDKYSRNYFRLNVIPMVEKIFPGAVEHMRENLTRFREVEMLYRDAVSQKVAGLVVEKGTEKHVPVDKLRMTIPLKTVLFEMFSPAGFSVGQLDDIIRLMDAETGKYVSSSTHRLLKNRNWFILGPERDTKVVSVYVVERDTAKVDTQYGSFFFSTVKKELIYNPDPDPFVAQLDASTLSFPLTIRKWREGDYFYPLGMRKKKKIARFLIDNKLSRSEKEKALVVLSGDKIIWVAGMRIDERAKVKLLTDMIFIMKYQFD